MRRFFAILSISLFSYPLFWSYCYAGGVSPYPMVRLGQSADDRYVVLEISKADLNADTQKIVFEQMAAKMKQILAEIKVKVVSSGDPVPIPPELLEEVYSEVNEAIAGLYAEQSEREKAYIANAEARDTSPAPRPAWVGMDTGFGLDSNWSRPTGYFATVSLKGLLRYVEEKRKRDEELAAEIVKNTAQIATGPAGAAKNVVGLGGDMQIGVLAVPILVKLIPKDPHSGLKTKEFIHLDFEPLLFPYADGKLGAAINSSSKMKPAFGAIFGDLKWGYEFKGELYSFSYDFDAGIDFGSVEGRWKGWAERLSHFGFNAKPGCVNNPRLDRGMLKLLPWCDFLFVMVRLQKRAVDISKKDRVRIPFTDVRLPLRVLARAEVRVNVGAALTGESMIRALMVTHTEQQRQDALEALSFIIDPDPTAKFSVENLDDETLRAIQQATVAADGKD